VSAVRRRCTAACLALAALFFTPRPASAYSVLAHEAAIDAAWDSAIQPLLRARFPRATQEDLDRARSYAYGGAVIQDLGYYPFGNHFFSNLLHYARSGDFVEALLREAGDIDDVAFAIGALAHYANDNTGHPAAVNLSVPLLFPKLRRKYGNEVTYEEAPKEHVIVEFSFDVAHTASAAYPLSAYRNLIGFRVATPLLERAFRDTYGLELRGVFGNLDRAISTYRYSVSQIIPALTESAWEGKQEEIEKLNPTASRASFILVYRRADFERDYGHDYQKPAFFARVLGFLYKFIPKIGPLKPLSFKVPTPDADRLFVQSIREADVRFAAALTDVRARRLDFQNTNFDTGRPSRRGEYVLADETYDELLDRLSKSHFEGATTALRQNIRAFYGSDPQPSPRSKQERKHWTTIERELRALMNSRG
jgi:hypothetical protein